MLRKITLYGHLAEKFGSNHKFNVCSVGEAVRALCANFPEFAQYVMERNEPGYKVLTNKESIKEDQLNYPSNGDIQIVPLIAGAKKGGVLNVVLGAALVAMSVWVPYLSSPAMTFLEGTAMQFSAASAMQSVGFSMLMGGVAQILFVPPKPDGPSDSVENRPSYLFNGAVNTAAQGNAIPVGYGKLLVGSLVISSSLLTH